MAEESSQTLVGKRISTTFRGLLHFPNSIDAFGNKQVIYDGSGTATGLQLGTKGASLSGVYQILTYNSVSPVYPGLQILNSSSTLGSSYIQLGGSNPSRGYAIYHRASDNVLKINYDTPIGVGITQIMTFLSSGKVGIGTDTPSTTLQVNGTVKANTLEINTLSTNKIQVASTTEDHQVNFGTTSLYSVYVKRTTPYNLYVKPSNQTEANAPLWIDRTLNEVHLPKVTVGKIRTAPTAGTPTGPTVDPNDLFRHVMPVGSVLMWPNVTPPAGWFECNGNEYDPNLYNELFTVLQYTYGTGTISTNFRVPDLRGAFVRGLDNSKNLDPGRTLGVVQSDGIKNHYHITSNPVNLVHNSTTTGVQRWRTAAAAESWADTVNSNTLLQGNNFGGITETRPVNYALVYIIKF